MLTVIAKILKILNSESKPGQISLALCLAMLMGLTPLFSAHNVITLFVVLFLRVNLSAFLLGWAGFSLVAYGFDPLFHNLGMTILTSPGLEGLFTLMYNIPFLRISAFNNSLVMGSLVVSMILFIPAFFLFKLLIARYRTDVVTWIQNAKLVQILKTSKLFSLYDSLS